MSFGAKILLIFFCIAFLFIVIGVNLDIDSTVVAYITVFVGGFAAFGLAALWEDKEKSEKIQYYTYDESTHTLTLIQRSYSAFSKAIKIAPLYTTTYKYNPAELEYNSVTVGSVTTGGFHVNPASYSPSSTEKTDKYELWLMPGNHAIKTIILPKDLIASAQNNSTIRKFLKGDRLELKYTGGDTELSESERRIIGANMTQRPDIMLNMTKRVRVAQALTKEDCEAIKNWLCQ